MLTNVAPPPSRSYRRQLELLGLVVVLQRQNHDQKPTVQQPGAQPRRDGVQRAEARFHRLLLNLLLLIYVNEKFKQLNFY